MKNSKSQTVLPRQARSIESRSRILDAAVEVFSEKGLHGARIDAIAQISGVNKQRIYAYFGSKKQLYREVLLKVYGEAAKSEHLVTMTENDLKDMTARVLRSFFDFHQNYPKFWKLLSWENLNGGKSLKPSDWTQIRESYVHQIETLYKIGQNKGIFSKQVSFDTYILVIFSFTYFYYSNQLTISHLLNCQLNNTSVRNLFEEQFCNLLLTGVQTGE